MANLYQHLSSSPQCRPEQHQAAQRSRRPQRRANNANTASLAAIADLIRSAPTVPVLSHLRDIALARWKAAYLKQPLDQQSSFASEFQTTFPTEHEALTKAIPYSPRCSTLVKWLADKSEWKLQALEVFAVFGTRSEQRLKEVKVIAGMCEREKGMALVQGLNKRDYDGYVDVKSYKAVVAQLEKEGCVRAPTRSRRNGVPKGTVKAKDTGQPKQSIAQCDEEVEGQSAEQSREDDEGQGVEQSHEDDEGQGVEQSREGDEDQGIAQSDKDRRQPSCEDEQEQGAESSVERSVEKRRGGHEPDLLDVSDVSSTDDDGELNVHFHDDDDDDELNVHFHDHDHDHDHDDGGGDGDETEFEYSARDVLLSSPCRWARARHATASSSPRNLPHSRPHQSESRLFHSDETFLQFPPPSPSPPHVTFADAQTQTTPVIPTNTMSTINTAPGSAAACWRPPAAEPTNKRRRMKDSPCASVDVDTTQLAACFKSLGVEDAPAQISDLLDGGDTERSVRAWVLKGALELLQTPGTPITHTPAALMQNLQSHASCFLESIKSEPSGDEMTDAALLGVRNRAAEVEAEYTALRVAQEVQFGISEMVKSTTNQTNDETLKAQRRKCAVFTEMIETLDPQQESEKIELLGNLRSAEESRLKEMEGWEGKKDQLVEVVRDHHDSYSKAVMRIRKRVVANRKRADQIAALLGAAELSTSFTTSHA